MPSIINTVEGGINGTAPTTANTGGDSGDAASVVTVGTGNTILFGNSRVAHGARGFEFLFGTSNGGNIHWDIAESGRLVHSFYVELSSLPSATDYIGGIRHVGGYMCIATIGSDGKFIMQNALGSGISASRAASTFPIGQMVRVEIAVIKGTTTSDGTIEYAYYLGDSTNAEATWSSSTQNTGTANVARVIIGRNTSATQSRTMWFDTIRAESLVSGWIGPYSVPTVLSISNTAEGGSNGDVPTTLNTGGVSGDAASFVTVGTGNTLLFTDYTPVHGALHYAFGYGTSSGGTMQWNIATPNRLVHSFYVEISSLPSAADYIGSIRHAGGNMCIATIGSDGKFIMQNSLGVGISASRASATFPVQEKIRVEIAVTKGTTTTDGIIEYAYYLGDAGTPLESWSSSAQNTGTADAVRVVIGRTTTGTQPRTMWFDTIRAKELASGWIGPYAAPNRLPVAKLGANVLGIEPWSVQTLNASSSFDYDQGTIVGYTFRQLSGTPVTINGTGALRTYEVPGTVGGEVLTFGLTVTDNQGANSIEDTVDHTILPVSERAVIGGMEVPVRVSIVSTG